MSDQLDVPLEDSELLAEVELTTNMMIAASGVDHLSLSDVDRLLGVERADSAEDHRAEPGLRLVGGHEIQIPLQKPRRAG